MGTVRILRHLSALGAAVAAILVAPGVASAELKVEVTLDGFSPGGAAGSAGKTIVLSPGDVGNPVTLAVWARVTGADTTATANDGLQQLCVNFRSTGPNTGNIAPLSHDVDFDASGFQSGTQFGSAGDLDLGSLNTASASGWWIGIADEVQSATGPASDGAGNFLLGKVTFTPTDLSSSGATLLQIDYRNVAPGALWFEDATITPQPGPDIWTNDFNPSTGTVSVGVPVSVLVPEPASMALLSMAAPLLLRRRRIARYDRV